MTRRYPGDTACLRNHSAHTVALSTASLHSSIPPSPSSPRSPSSTYPHDPQHQPTRLPYSALPGSPPPHPHVRPKPCACQPHTAARPPVSHLVPVDRSGESLSLSATVCLLELFPFAPTHVPPQVPAAKRPCYAHSPSVNFPRNTCVVSLLSPCFLD